MTYENDDPFAGGDGVPHYSWKDRPIGHKVTGTVTTAPKPQQARKFAGKGVLGDLDYWKDGNPKMEVVWNMEVAGEEFVFHAAKPSSMLAAIGAAQQAAGARVQVGATLTVTLTELRDVGKGNPQNVFAAVLRPADAFAATPTPAPETRPAVPAAEARPAWQPAAEPANPLEALRALRPQIAELTKAGFTPSQIIAFPGMAVNGVPLTEAMVATILGLAA